MSLLMFDEEIEEGLDDYNCTEYCWYCSCALNEDIISDYHEHTCGFCEIQYIKYGPVCTRCVKELFEDHRQCGQPIDII